MVEEVVGDAASGEGIGVEDEVSFSIHLYIGTILFLDICPLNCFTTSIIVSSSVSLDSSVLFSGAASFTRTALSLPSPSASLAASPAASPVASPAASLVILESTASLNLILAPWWPGPAQ